MPITLYHFPMSPPSRIALTTVKTLGLDVSVKIVDLANMEHLGGEYLKINPQHTVPALDDNGFIIWDSHAIITYLVDKHGQDDSLYPKDVCERAVVNQRLFFDACTLFQRMKDIIGPVFYGNKNTVDEDKKKALHEALGWLDSFLQTTGWVAGGKFTVADIACSVTTSSIQAMGAALGSYPNIEAWLARCQEQMPHFQEVNKVGNDAFKQLLASKLLPEYRSF